MSAPIVDWDDEPIDLAEERRRLVVAIEALDDGDLHTAACVIYGTQGRLARASMDPS